MTVVSRRQILVGAAATAAVASLPGVADAAPADRWQVPGITWDGRHSMRSRLWKRAGNQWPCLVTIIDPVSTIVDDAGGPGMETHLQAVPPCDRVASDDLAEEETDTLKD
jgi:hypothetical protein